MQKTVLISGHFNVLHAGHLRLFKFAKSVGDRLVVVVLNDEQAGFDAILPSSLRLEGVKNNKLVDECFIADKPVIDIINEVRPFAVVKGKEFEQQFNIEAKIIEEIGSRLIFNSGESTLSEVDLLQHEFNENRNFHQQAMRDFRERHHINPYRLTSILQKFTSLKVCVVGDLIVDEYITCNPLGMSQEDPTIVVTPVEEEKFLGGAGIVAAHAAGLGASVDFFSVVGNDALATTASDELSSFDVNFFPIVDTDRPTTQKQRFRARGKTLLRVSRLSQSPISLSLQEELCDQIRGRMAAYDLLVFSDFNYGCLPQNVVEVLMAKAKEHNVMVAADSQASSQMSDISRFKGADLLTPTEYEARLSLKNQSDGIPVLAADLAKLAEANTLLLKLGGDGVFIYSTKDESDGWNTDRIVALNTAPSDVAGAGDSMLVSAALSIAAGADVWEAALVGSVAASVQVSTVGNTPLEAEKLARVFQS